LEVGMGFWEAATYQAGREFGARHWRWFVGVRIARRLAPVIAVLVILGALMLAYRMIAPDWAAIGKSVSEWVPSASSLPSVGQMALWGILVVIGLVIVIALARWVGNNWWRWWMHRPMWMRRY
jgi:hypothetical protein